MPLLAPARHPQAQSIQMVYVKNRAEMRNNHDNKRKSIRTP